MSIPVIFPDSLLADLSQYGYLGLPAAPISLKSTFLNEGSRILVTWRQHRSFPLDKQETASRRNDVTKFVIQRGVTNLANSNITHSSNESISTASVPLSVSVDRNELDQYPQDTSVGFINFEVIGELMVQSGVIVNDSTFSTSDFKVVIPKTKFESGEPHSHTLGVPPSTMPLNPDEQDFLEESKDTEHSDQPPPILVSEHSFDFDASDYASKLLHFRVKSINREG